MKTIVSATLDGFDAKVVDVEVAFVRALPSFTIVGLAQTSIQESKERVKSALSTIDFKFPPQKVTVNLSPSDLRKEGSHFDLPIAMLIALQKEKVEFEGFMAFGELGLDGTLKDTKSLFAIILSLVQEGKVTKVIIPKESVEKISKIPNLEIYPAQNLEEALAIFMLPQTAVKCDSSVIEEVYHDNYLLDFSEIKGQENAKRASLIAAAGMHNILFEGSPGCGKTMSAKRLQYILSPMTKEEVLYKAKLDALDGKEPDFSITRPFRSPHHSATRASIFGGGSKNAKIGEVALAHNGILYFDEFPHFPKVILESLREPLEDYKVLISRVNNKIEYQTKFLFIASMNPCPCGNLLSTKKDCRCSDLEIKRYKNRLSSPLLDRIDLYVQMEEISAEDKATVTSKQMHTQVKSATALQEKRGQSERNGKMSDGDVDKFCKLDSESQSVLENASNRFDLSQRAIKKCLKVARTIADLDAIKDIQKVHLIEALRYRTMPVS